MLTSAIEVQKYVKASAGRAKLNVVFEACNQPRHDGDTIYLPMITYKTTEKELKQLMASTDHEVAHDLHSSFNVIKKEKLSPKSITMFTWNFIEDSRVNTIDAKEYRGFRENMDECNADLIQGILKSIDEGEPNLMKVLTGALIKWESELNAALFPVTESVTHSFVPNKAIYDILRKFDDRLLATHLILDKEEGTQSTIDLARDILKELASCKDEGVGDLIDKAPKGESEDGEETPAVSADPKKKGEGDKGDKSSKTSKTEGKADTAKAEGDKPTSEEDDEYKIIRITVTEEQLDALSVSIPEDGKKMGKTGINFAPVKTSGSYTWNMTDLDEFIVADYPRNRATQDKYLSANPIHFIREYNTRVAPLLVTQENFAQQVRRLIQIRARVQTEYGIKKGKLDQSRLSRVIFKQPGYSDRIFKRRIENKTLDAAVSILVDMSGSMSGDKAYYALASTLLMNEVCSTLGISSEIVGFSDDSNMWNIQPSMFIYKSFADRHVPEDKMKEYFARSSNFMQGNPDGENILWMYDRLLKRKEKRRILVVMSDGAPAASKSSSGLTEFTLKTIREIETQRKVEIYGLGLCSNSVEHYYKAHSIVTHPAHIPTKLLELIERKILT